MLKRAAPESLQNVQRGKRLRFSPDCLSSLTDELLLRVLSYLPIHDLIVCHRISRRFQEISGDAQLWKAAYYKRFIKPRVLKMPGRRSQELDSRILARSSKLSKWLDEGHLVKRGTSTNWKRQYKIRHNWSQGSCDVKQIPVTSRPPVPQLLARLHHGIVYTVDSTHGFRAWCYKTERKVLACGQLEQSTASKQTPLPTSLAVDTHNHDTTQQRLLVGYENGGYGIYSYDKVQAQFHHIYTHPPSSNGVLSAVALTTPYVLTMTENHILSLYNFDSIADQPSTGYLDAPRLLTSLKSHTIWSPVSLALRNIGLNVVASVAYCLPTINSGWSVGIQELHIMPDGSVSSSRLASADSHDFTHCEGILAPTTSQRTLYSKVTTPYGQILSKPTSLSYSHPYILVSHSDNTLTLYLATSTALNLLISAGRQLFGHTSAVFSAHVGVRGKAVSVGIRGNEIRVWELEGASVAASARSRNMAGDFSVQVTPDSNQITAKDFNSISQAINKRGNGLGLALGNDNNDWAVTRGWVGFDDENLIVLRDQQHGGQALTVYDFS